LDTGANRESMLLIRKPSDIRPSEITSRENYLNRRQFMAAGAAAVVCNDSGIMNIASAVGRPPVVVIGPTRSGHTGPYTGTAVVAEVACQGCRKKRCRHVTCMESIEPSRILSAVEGCLDAGSDSCR